MSAIDEAKRQAAMRALDHVRPGMTLGLGTGSTAAHFVIGLGARLREGLVIAGGVPTSEATAALARHHGVPLIEIAAATQIDLAIDGADEIDPALTLIKGGGGALLREKIVAAAAARFIVVADAGKRVARLGRFPLPVEVTPFAWPLTARKVAEALRAAGCGRDILSLRQKDGAPFVTDGGNFILDCQASDIPEAATLAAALDATPGVVEHGLFIGLAHEAIVV
jgi:ribose 5-phosphate isomerase A